MSGSYVAFKLAEKKPKTFVYDVISRSSDEILGKVFWHALWRQYVFEPFGETVWSASCLYEIELFLKLLMESHVLKRRGGVS